MDFQSFTYFVKVAETQSLTKAAQNLYISQQALSKSMSRLEEEFGVRLLVRNHDGAILTEYGKQFLEYALATISNHDSFIKNIVTMKDSGKDSVYFSYATGIDLNLSEDFISRFMARHPDARYFITSYQDDAYHRTIVFSGTNLIFGSGVPKTPFYDTVAEAHCPVGIMMAKSNPLAQKQILTWADLQNAELMQLNIETSYNEALNQLFTAHHITPQYVINPAEKNFSRYLACSCNAISVAGMLFRGIPDWAVILPLEGLHLTMDFYLCKRKEYQLNETEETFVREFKEELQSMTGPRQNSV